MVLTRRAMVAGLVAGVGAACSGVPGGSVLGLRDSRGHRGTGRGPAPSVTVTEWKDRVADKDRTGWLVVPTQYDPQKMWPLVLFSHGSNQDGRMVLTKFLWDQACEERGYIGIFPDTGGDFTRGQPDNEFFTRLLDRAVSTLSVNTERIYAGGFSGGCKRMYSFAANHSDRIAAMAGHSGTMGHFEEPAAEWDPRLRTISPISLLHIHGMKDPSVSPRGGVSVKEDGKERNTISMREGMEIWAGAIGAELVRDAPRPEGLPGRCQSFEWRSADGHVVMGIVDPDLAHSWAPYSTDVVADFFDRAPPKVKPTGTPSKRPTL